MLNAIQQGIFNKSTKGRLDELEAVKSDLEVKIIQEEMQRLIDSFVNAIYLYDDHLVITFNYKEGSKTISLSDVINAVNKSKSGSDLSATGALIFKEWISTQSPSNQEGTFFNRTNGLSIR